MDWLRRNWPDLLIGVALIAVIAMIVATLLSGGSLASLVRRDGPPEVPITSTTGTGTTGDTTNPNPDPAGTATTPAPNTAGTGEAQTPDNLDVFVPDVPDRSAAGGVDEDTDGSGTQASTPQDGTQSGSVAEAATTLPTASAAGGFRVAAGATPSRDAAGTLAQTYRDGGYEVAVEQQGDLYLLWIGPYASDAGAERIAARLRADGQVPDALVYTYNRDDEETVDSGSGVSGSDVATLPAQPGADVNEADEAASADPGNGDVDSGSAATTGTETQTPENSVNAGGVGEKFLQVGAFASNESAQPLRAQLEGLNLSVTSSEDASGLVRLFVGPFGGEQLVQTQQRLSAEGIVGSFPVTR